MTQDVPMTRTQTRSNGISATPSNSQCWRCNDSHYVYQWCYTMVLSLGQKWPGNRIAQPMGISCATPAEFFTPNLLKSFKSGGRHSVLLAIDHSCRASTAGWRIAVSKNTERPFASQRPVRKNVPRPAANLVDQTLNFFWECIMQDRKFQPPTSSVQWVRLHPCLPCGLLPAPCLRHTSSR